MNVTVDKIERHAGEYLHRVLDGETVFCDDRPVAEIRPLSPDGGVATEVSPRAKSSFQMTFDESLLEDVLEQF